MQTQPQGTVEAFDVSIPTNGGHARGISLPGRLCLPAPPTGLVIFAHGSGSSRHSPRNALVALVLGAAAALVAAAGEPRVLAIVSRGGRPDLAGFQKSRMQAMWREPNANREDTQVENLCYEQRQRGAVRAREPALLTNAAMDGGAKSASSERRPGGP